MSVAEPARKGILSKIVRPTDPMKVTALVVTLYGEPGVGKTTLANTASRPLTLDFDRGSHRARNRKDVLPIESWADIEDLMREPAVFAPYDTVVVDTVGRCLDFLTAKIIAANSKHGAAGALSQQGWGVLGSSFAGWLNALRLHGKDVVLIAHGKEDRRSETIIARLDIKGGSNGEVLKNSDIVGFVAMGGGGRLLDCNPDENHVGKNPAGWPAYRIPDTNQDPTFLGRLIAEAKGAMSQIAEGAAEAARLVEEWRADIAKATDASAINRLLREGGDLPEIVKVQVKALLVARARELALTFDKTAKAYADPQAAAPAAAAPPAPEPEPTVAAAPATEEAIAEETATRQPGEDDEDPGPDVPDGDGMEAPASQGSLLPPPRSRTKAA